MASVVTLEISMSMTEVMALGLAALNKLNLVMVADQVLGDGESFLHWVGCFPHARLEYRAASQTYYRTFVL